MSDSIIEIERPRTLKDWVYLIGAATVVVTIAAVGISADSQAEHDQDPNSHASYRVKMDGDYAAIKAAMESDRALARLVQTQNEQAHERQEKAQVEANKLLTEILREVKK